MKNTSSGNARPRDGSSPAETHRHTNSEEEADQMLAVMAKAISHPTRVRILRILAKRDARVCSQIVDEFPVAQSTVSEHLRILKESGLINSRADGPRIQYCINRVALEELKELVRAL